MPIKDYSTNPNNNNASPPHGAPEGMKPSDVNNVMRQIMADIRSYAEAGGWTNLGHIPTYIANDKFTVAGDVRSIYVTGRMLKISISGADVYSAIASSKLSGNNTEIILYDEVLNNTMAEVYLGLQPEVLNNIAGVNDLCIAESVNNGNEITLKPISGILASPSHKGTELSFYSDSNNTSAVKLNGKELKYTSADKLVDLKTNYIKTGNYYKIRYDGVQWVVIQGLAGEASPTGLSLRATITPGKFFTRKANGDLPSGIDSNKVWSLADQKSNNVQPAGKTEIEIPIGIVTFIDTAGGPSNNAKSCRTWMPSGGWAQSNITSCYTVASERGTAGTLKNAGGTDLLLGASVFKKDDGTLPPSPSGGAPEARASETRKVIVTTAENQIYSFTLGKKAPQKSVQHTFTASFTDTSGNLRQGTSQQYTFTNTEGTDDGFIEFRY